MEHWANGLRKTSELYVLYRSLLGLLSFFVRITKTDQIGWMPLLMGVLTGRTAHSIVFFIVSTI